MSKRVTIAAAVLLLALAVAIGLAVTYRSEPGPATPEIVAQREAVQNDCASRKTFEGLKKLVFDRAGRSRTSDDTANFAVLAETAFVRMENPVVENRDETLDLTACSGRFILELPPGAERAFGGERRLTATVQYEVQPAADGSGPVFRMSGADAIVAQLAGFELQGEPLQAPIEPATDEADLNATSEIFAPEIPAEPPPAPPPPPEPRAFSNPSYDCRDAGTRSEIMVCRSDRLARADRRMAAVYDSAMAAADPSTRRILRRTRDAFLAYRERCGSEDCIAEAYEGRTAEIRDIMAARGY